MRNFIKLALFLTLFLITGCIETKKAQPIAPLKPVFKTYIDLPDENWPPRDNNTTQCIDLSDFNIPATNNTSQNAIGKAKVIGTISLFSPNGNKIIGAYSNIYLRNLTTKQGIVYGDYMQSTMSDNNGKFKFDKIPNGRYKVTGSLNCGVECGYDTNKTITLGKIITMDRNSTYSVNLSNSKPSVK
jgi:hypothetical protein